MRGGNQMAILTEQSVLSSLQSVFRAMLRLPPPEGASANALLLEELWLEMVSSGDRLVDALQMERDFRAMDARDEVVLEQWRQYRSAVEHLAEQYATTMARWREAVEEDCQIVMRTNEESGRGPRYLR